MIMDVDEFIKQGFTHAYKEFIDENNREPNNPKEIMEWITKKKEKALKEIQPNKNILKDWLNQISTKFNNPTYKPYIYTKNLIRFNLNESGFFDEHGYMLSIMQIHEIEKTHIFKMDKIIRELLMKTDGKINFIKLPFISFFLDTFIEINNCIMFGLFIHYAIKKKELEKEFSDIFKSISNREIENLLNKLTDNEKNIQIYCLGYDFNDNTIFYKNFFIEEKGLFKKNQQKTCVTPTFEKELNMEDLNFDTKLSLFVCNFLNFLNDPNVELITIERTKEQNEKRILKGKDPIPPQVFIRITGKLKIYLDQLKSGGHFSYSHRFWVRGHFRTLRSEKWKKAKGTKIWIPPYIKGKGILVNKIYDVKK